jgi:hypothetical protein
MNGEIKNKSLTEWAEDIKTSAWPEEILYNFALHVRASSVRTWESFINHNSKGFEETEE